jgi:hypothetical protein
MKIKLILLTLFVSTYHLKAQNSYTILPTGISPGPSAIVNLPMLSYDDILALPSPVAGTQVYDITFKSTRIYNGTKWISLDQSNELGDNSPNAAVLSDIVPEYFYPGSGGFAPSGLALVPNGELILSGLYNKTLIFHNTTTISSSGTGLPFSFIAKYTKSGNLVYVKSITASKTVIIKSITTDPTGNIYATGYFEGSMSLGSSVLTSANNLSDIFVAKFDAAGNAVWAKQFNAAESSSRNLDVITDSNNNVYVTGSFKGNLNLGSGLTASNIYNQDIFLAKFNSSGSPQALLQYGGPNDDEGKSLAVNNAGNVIMVGDYGGGSPYGFIPFIHNIFGGKDVFVVEYNFNTNSLVSVKVFGGTGNDEANSVAMDNQGNVNVAGSFSNSITLGTNTFTSQGLKDAYITTINSSGTHTAFFNFGSSESDEIIKDMFISPQGDYYLAGYHGYERLGSGLGSHIKNVGLEDLNSFNMYPNSFFIKKSPDFRDGWQVSYGYEQEDYGEYIVVDTDNNVFGAGSMRTKMNIARSTSTLLPLTLGLYLIRFDK